MATTKKYWKGIDELKQTPAFVEHRDKEFVSSSTVEDFLGDEKLQETSTARRDFLKFLGFSVAAATVAACEAPVTKAIPYVNKPENVTPGAATWYASTYYDGNSYASIMVKTREGRPIYIKGNRDHGFTQGALTPQIVASVLGLYDSARLQKPVGAKDWAELDNKVGTQLRSIAQSGGKIAVVSNTIISPSLTGALAELSASLYGGAAQDGMADVFNPNFSLIQYDAVSYNGMREANLASFGQRAIPDYDFTQAKTIVSIGADFLSTWLMGNAFSADYGKRRVPDGEWMSRHFQFESVMSITGSNADYRAMIKPSEQAAVLSYILSKFGVNTGVSASLKADVQKVADEAVRSLRASANMSVVVSGSNNTAVQILTNKLNSVLGAYGKTIRFDKAINLFQSEDAKMQKLVSDVIAGQAPQAIIFLGTNPVYNLPNGKEFGEKLKNVPLTVAISTYADETASKCKFIAADHHALEAWADHNPKMGHYALSQPTIRPLHNTASCMETILVWAGKAQRGGKDSRAGYDYIAANWQKFGFAMQTEHKDFGNYWNFAVHNSVVSDTTNPMFVAPVYSDAGMAKVAGNLPKGGDVEVILYQKAGIGTGEMAGNPWLQEMPDPISKVTWDNYITMNPSEMEGTYATTFDQEHGLNMATVTVNGKSITLPVYPSPGQAPKTVGIALGYGRGEGNEEIGNAAYVTKQYGGFETDENNNRVPVGKNAYRFMGWSAGGYTTDVAGTIRKEEGIYPIAATQIHHTVMARNSIVRETSLEIFENEDPSAYNHKHMLQALDADGNHVAKPIEEFDLWDAHPVEDVGHRWGMAIDLNQCFGCGVCMIACQSENNVPVVGKDEVRRGREMHWLRIDRYFSSDEEATIGTRKGDIDYGKAEVAAMNPKVVHMPMLCQHCNHAPCETVCPVAATTHSNEGLNQMAYNRCIGTRYCANNCPYKVRRFNWFNYPSYKKFTEINPAQDDLGRMVLNPDVTVRTRGVMEKCTFCVQRIQGAKLQAKVESRMVEDKDFTTACAEACPADAISFGDWNNVKSAVRRDSKDRRAYQALEEVGVKPNIWYKVKVRNEENAELGKLAHEAHAHHAPAAGHGTSNKNHH
jgi:MoCo/4Fe-4S cofactor protein with predicted Tat translocation signal